MEFNFLGEDIEREWLKNDIYLQEEREELKLIPIVTYEIYQYELQQMETN